MGLVSAKGDYDNSACAPRGLHETKGVRHYDKTALQGDHNQPAHHGACY